VAIKNTRSLGRATSKKGRGIKEITYFKIKVKIIKAKLIKNKRIEKISKAKHNIIKCEEE